MTSLMTSSAPQGAVFWAVKDVVRRLIASDCL